jgi:5'-methylthioadenosine phosphorylase
MATVTDYDCWREGEEEVSVETVLKVLSENSARAKIILQHVIRGLQMSPDCSCHHALSSAICTERILIPDRTVGQLGPIISKYM